LDNNAAVITHLSDGELMARIQAKLASGVLPLAGPKTVLGGPSAGQRCAGCDEKIATAEAEIEVDGPDDQRRYFHGRCFTLLTGLRGRN
jgi:hypothetical protein